MRTRTMRYTLPAFAVAAVALAVGAHPPRAQQPAPVTPPAPAKVVVLTSPKADVTQFGARAQTGFDNAPAFQAAHDALAAYLKPYPGQKGSLYIPPNVVPYDVATTTWIDAPNIIPESDSSGATCRSGLLGANGVSMIGCPVFALGYRRPTTIGGAYAANFATYRPDLFGKLDASVASAAGQRWGFRTNANAFIMAPGSPFSHGAISPTLGFPYVDNWAETKSLTIEFAVEGFGPGGQIPLQTPLFGASDANFQNTYPALCTIDGSGQFGLMFQTQAQRFGPFATSRANMQQAPGGGVQRVTWQIDLVKGQMTGWLNGVQKFSGTCPIGGNLREAEDYPFLIGGADFSAAWGTVPSDFAAYGFATSKTLRYRPGAVGTAQARASDGAVGAKITDNYRFFDDSTDRGNGITGLVGYFALLEPPSLLSPLLSIPCGASVGYAAPAYIGMVNQTALGGIGPYMLKNLNIQNARPYGTALLIGEVLDMTVRDCQFSGGMWSVATLPMTSVYTLIFDRCQFSCQGDAAAYLYFATARFRDTMIPNGGRATLRFRETNAVVDGLFVAGANSNCQFSVARYHAGYNGGQVSIRDVLQDVEGKPTPTRAVVGAERGPAPSGQMIRLVDINAGIAPGVPFLWLDAGQTAQNWPANVVAADNAFAGGITAQSVTNGLGWSVSAVNAGPVQPVPVSGPIGTKRP